MNRSIIQIRNLSKDARPAHISAALREAGCPREIRPEDITMVGDRLGGSLGIAMVRLSGREEAAETARWIRENTVMLMNLPMRAEHRTRSRSEKPPKGLKRA